MDALQHVNNTRYFVWFESARMALFERVGLVSEGQPEIGPILAHASCDFRRPVVYPAEISVGVRIGRIGRTSFVMEYEAVETKHPDLPVATSECVIVLINYKTGEKLEIPKILRVALSTLTSQSQPS